MFPIFERCHPSSETEVNKKLLINHLGVLQKQFSFDLKTLMSPNVNGIQIHCHEQYLWTNDL
jgi:hypothetical protein